MTRLLIVIGVALVGCNQAPSTPRYQVAAVGTSTIVRLDTQTGDLRRFVVTLGGDFAAPSDIRIVRDQEAVAGCDPLGNVVLEAAREMAAVKGGDTVLYAKSRSGTDEASAYRCKKESDLRQ